MIVYCLLLLPAALLAYFLGSMNTIVLASNFVFHKNLLRLGTGNLWFSNFRRVYGILGFVKLLLVEVVRDLVPILLSGLILGFKGHAQVGFVFGGFCLVLGRLYPILYNFKGSSASFCMAIGAMFVAPTAGIATLIVMAAVLLVSRYISLATVAGAVVYAAVAVLMADDALIRRLALFAALLVIFKHIPALMRVFSGREEKFEDTRDVTYKFDEKF